MTVISIINQKGGSGKTTTSQHIAIDKACSGKKVLFIDTDKQGTAIKFFARNHLKFPDGYDGVIDATRTKPETLQATLEKYQGKYDYIYIDTPPSVDENMSNVISLSDVVLIPCQPKFKDIEAAQDAVDSIQYNRKIKPGIKAAFVVTRKAHNQNVDNRLEQMAGLGIDVLNSHITELKAYDYADESGVGVIHLNNDIHPSVAKAAADIHTLSNEIANYIAR